MDNPPQEDAQKNLPCQELPGIESSQSHYALNTDRSSFKASQKPYFSPHEEQAEIPYTARVPGASEYSSKLEPKKNTAVDSLIESKGDFILSNLKQIFDQRFCLITDYVTNAMKHMREDHVLMTMQEDPSIQEFVSLRIKEIIDVLH
jgi:hypothetical protein